MSSAYEPVVPPEYKIRSTQTTQYGEPVVPQITQRNFGTFGRSVTDSNDMSYSNMSEVWKSGESPMKTAEMSTALEVQRLRHLTRTGQMNPQGVTKREGGTRVTYGTKTRDEQVSNVQGMSFTGDPKSLGQALKIAGQNPMTSERALDGDRTKAVLHRQLASMSPASAEAFAEVLRQKGGTAIEALSATPLAGVLVENLGVSEAGVVIHGMGNLGAVANSSASKLAALKAKTVASLKTRSSAPSKTPAKVVTVGTKISPKPATVAPKPPTEVKKLPTKPTIMVTKPPTGSTVKPPIVKPNQVAPSVKKTEGGSSQVSKETLDKLNSKLKAGLGAPRPSTNEGSMPSAFKSLAQQASLKQQLSVAAKSSAGSGAQVHPAQTNYQNVNGAKAASISAQTSPTAKPTAAKTLGRAKLPVTAAKTSTKTTATTKTAKPVSKMTLGVKQAVTSSSGNALQTKTISAAKALKDAEITAKATEKKATAAVKEATSKGIPSATSASALKTADAIKTTLKSANNARKSIITKRKTAADALKKATDEATKAQQSGDQKKLKQAWISRARAQQDLTKLEATDETLAKQQQQAEERLQSLSENGDVSQDIAQDLHAQVDVARTQEKISEQISQQTPPINISITAPSTTLPGVASSNDQSYVANDSTVQANADSQSAAPPMGITLEGTSTAQKIAIGTGVMGLAVLGAWLFWRSWK